MYNADFEIPNRERLVRMLALLGLAGISVALSLGNFTILAVIAALPILIILTLYVVQYPIILFFTFFTWNYFIIGFSRYIPIEGSSVSMDILLVSTLVLIVIHGALTQDIQWKYAFNMLTLVTFLWMIYCLLEIMNPTGMLKAWILSRSLIFNGLIISIITSLLITQYRQIDTIIALYAFFTLLAIIKVLIQRYVGFDSFELRWLNEGGALTHVIHSGTRYFSFFTDAGNFGSNMGCSAVIFGILTFSASRKGQAVYYGILSALSLYAMFLSGTRGAMIVPLGGVALYILISKNYKAIVGGSILLTAIYCFFVFTYIGESNSLIRRMRSSFRPTKDGSFNVRRENQKKLAAYLKDRPFGEGLGLSGGENRKMSVRFTTQIPHDSWYVKIWVETGIVGLVLYLTGLIAVVIKCARIIMFKIKNKKLKNIFSALLCGIFGMMLSSYGNAIWGQFPTMIIAYVFLSLILKGAYFDKQIETQKRLV